VRGSKIVAVAVVVLAVAGAAAYLALPRGGGGSSGGEAVLKVLNYSDYMDPEVIKEFEREYHVKVVYDEYEAAEEAWAKLKAGGAGYDVIITAHSYVGLARQMGLLHPLNKSMLPNLKYLDPRVARHPADPNQDYAVPYMWGTTGIAYLDNCVDSPPQTWREFFNTTYLKPYKGRVSLLSEFSEAIMAAMIALGYDPSVRSNWNDQVMSQVEQLLQQVKPYLVGFYGASQYSSALVSGQLCLAEAWSGDVLFLQQNNSHIQFVNPRDGALYWVDFIVIPRDAKHVKEAHEFINFLLRPDVAARNVKYVWYASGLRKEVLLDWARQHNDTELVEILENPLVYPSSDVKLIPSPVLDEEMSRYVETVRLHVLGG